MTRARTDPGLRNRDPGMPGFNPLLAVYLRRQLVQAVETYQQRGRKFAKLDDAALRERFIGAFDTWAAAEPDGVPALNDAAAEFLLRRQPAPIEEIADQVGSVLNGSSRGDPRLEREPLVVIAIGRWLFAPFMGALLVANNEPDEAAQARDFNAMMAAVAPRRVR